MAHSEVLGREGGRITVEARNRDVRENGRPEVLVAQRIIQRDVGRKSRESMRGGKANEKRRLRIELTERQQDLLPEAGTVAVGLDHLLDEGLGVGESSRKNLAEDLGLEQMGISLVQCRCTRQTRVGRDQIVEAVVVVGLMGQRGKDLERVLVCLRLSGPVDPVDIEDDGSEKPVRSPLRLADVIAQIRRLSRQNDGVHVFPKVIPKSSLPEGGVSRPRNADRDPLCHRLKIPGQIIHPHLDRLGPDRGDLVPADRRSAPGRNVGETGLTTDIFQDRSDLIRREGGAELAADQRLTEFRLQEEVLL